MTDDGLPARLRRAADAARAARERLRAARQRPSAASPAASTGPSAAVPPAARSTMPAAVPARTEPPFDPSSWGGALAVMFGFAALLWVVQIVNSAQHYRLDRFGLRPRQVSGLWGVVTQPFLHDSWGHLVSNTAPVILIGWVLLTAGLRVWLFVTAVVIVLGGLGTWLVAPTGLIVGASGMVFGWLGYLLARAVFSRRIKWIVIAAALLFFFGALLGSLVPTLNGRVSWQSHLCGFVAGVLVGWLLHPRKASRSGRGRGGPYPVRRGPTRT